MAYSPSQNGSVEVVEQDTVFRIPRMFIFLHKLLSSTCHIEMLLGKLFQFKSFKCKRP